MKIADEQNLDLVEIAPTANPPVCRVIDYQKFLYAQKKKQKEAKANQKKQEVKEIRFGPQTDDHDYNFKLKHAMEFLKEGNKVKAYVFFRGRSIVFKEQGELLLARFANDLAEYGKPDNVPNLEGKRMILFISPKSQKWKVIENKVNYLSIPTVNRRSTDSQDLCRATVEPTNVRRLTFNWRRERPAACRTN